MPPERASKGPGIKGGGIAAVGAGIGFAASIAVAIGFLIATSGHLDDQNPWYLLSSQLALWAGFVCAPIVASRQNGTRSLVRDFGLSWPRWRDLYRGLAGGLLGRLPPTLVLLLLVLATHGLNTSTAAGRQIGGVTPEGTAGWIVSALILVVGAPVIEELFFRGLVQGAFTRRVGAIPAIFVTALIFSIAHILNEGPFAPLVIFPGALVLGYLRHRYGRLAPGMVAHGVFNALGFALLLVPGFR
jgi:membrane protease YdiL (CAAX protease family)